MVQNEYTHPKFVFVKFLPYIIMFYYILSDNSDDYESNIKLHQSKLYMNERISTIQQCLWKRLFECYPNCSLKSIYFGKYSSEECAVGTTQGSRIL